MPFLNIPPQTVSAGLDVVSLEENVSEINSTDEKNGIVSIKGSAGHRPGMAKDSTTAKSNPPIYTLMELVTMGGKVIDMYRDSSGNVVTY